MKRKNLMPAIVLTSICVITALLLALVNMFTAPVIEEANFAAMKASLKEVMPNGDFDPEPDELSENAPETVKSVYTDKNGGGKVVILVTNKGYTGKEIGITVGVDNDGKIINLKITKNEESIVPPALKPGGSYGDSYIGIGADEIDELVTGATVKYTESAIKGAVNDALSYLGYGDGGVAAEELPKTDAEIEALAKELNPAFGELEAIEADDVSEFVKRLYKDKSGNGYFAYIVTNTEWNPCEAELGVAFDKDGKVSATRLLAWNLSPTYEHNDIPGEGFVSGFIGKDTEEIENVELITYVTQTSGRVRDAIASAANALPRTDAKVSAVVSELLGKSVKLDAFAPEGVDGFVKASYKLSDGSGYVAYIVTSTEWNKHESEAVVIFDNDGKVTGVKLLAWNLSPTYEHNDIPGDGFAESLVGKDETTLPNVELITYVTQTSGRLRDSVLSFSKAVSLPTSLAEITEIAGELIGADVTLENITPDGINDMVKRLYRTSDGNAYVAYIVTYTEWNKHECEAVVSLAKDGKVTGVKLLAWNLSPTYEHNDIPGDGFAESLVGKDETTLPNVELITYVTQTSGRFRDAVLAVAKAVSLPTAESEIFKLADELRGTKADSSAYTDVTPANAPVGVKRIYRANDGSYVFYLVTFTEWNPRETETVVTVGRDGKVTGTKLITWQLSPTYEHKDTPGDGFTASLVGKDETTLPEVELVTNVTQTTTRIRDALMGALGCVEFGESEGESFAPRIVGIVALVLALAGTVAAVIISKKRRKA